MKGVKNVHAPFIYTSPALTFRYMLTLIMLCVHILALVLFNDIAAVMVIITVCITMVATDALSAYVNTGVLHAAPDVVVIGMLTGFFLPSSIPLMGAAIIAMLAYLLICEVMGGFGGNWISPALFAFFCAYLAYPHLFAAPQVVPFDWDASVTLYANTLFFNKIGVTLPEGMLSLLWYYPASIPAFRFTILTGLCSLVFFGFHCLNSISSFIFMGVYVLMFGLFMGTGAEESLFSGNMIDALVKSGLMFISVFIFLDEGTLPATVTGRSISAVLTAIVSLILMSETHSFITIPFALIASFAYNPSISIIEKKCYALKRRQYDRLS